MLISRYSYKKNLQKIGILYIIMKWLVIIIVNIIPFFYLMQSGAATPPPSHKSEV